MVQDSVCKVSSHTPDVIRANNKHIGTIACSHRGTTCRQYLAIVPLLAIPLQASQASPTRLTDTVLRLQAETVKAWSMFPGRHPEVSKGGLYFFMLKWLAWSPCYNSGA